MPEFRPPWWPEGEPFPPRGGPPGWAGMRRHFFRRIVVFLLLLFLLLFGIGALLSALFGPHGGGPGGPGGPGWRFFPFGLLWFLFLGGLFLLVGRAVRHTARPVADVMQAADRVAAGDYSARVHPAGPTDIRRLGSSFNQMAERLAATEQQRRNLLADVAHDLKTPLSVIRGNVEGVLDGLYPADEEHLRPVVEETAVMLRLLEDLQTLSSAEAGMLKLFPEPVDPRALVDEAVAAFLARANEKGVRLTSDSTPDVTTIEADPIRVAEVLANLVSNAVRHTPTGGSVRVAVARDGEGVRFSVADTGPGIPADQLPHVFERFVKSADSGGSGLGLAIAKRLVEAHGGTIEARSADGVGTEIRFALPARPPRGT